MHETTTTEALRDAVLAMAEALDPDRQGAHWPDPIAWDGRPLIEQARDLLAVGEATGDYAERDYRTDREVYAAEALRAALARAVRRRGASR